MLIILYFNISFMLNIIKSDVIFNYFIVTVFTVNTIMEIKKKPFAAKCVKLINEFVGLCKIFSLSKFGF